jgi:cytochrome b
MAREAAVVRVWDLPTRLFHWTLAFGVVAAIVSARLGGAAMTWHMRFGYGVFTLLAFRLLWGFVGGRWSRFRTFVTGPATTLRYLRGASLAHEHHDVGHTPLGAWSVLALLVVLAAQVATGLVADDEIASNGPLFKYVADATSAAASHWHRLYGQWLIIFLALLHVGAVAFWWLRREKNLVGPMLHGDKALAGDVPATRDTLATRIFALALVAGCAVGVALIARLGD